MLEPLYGFKADEGLAMWVADMEFKPPQVVQDALQKMLDHGVYGYFGDDTAYLAAIRWWMQTRHGWEVQPDWIFTTHGLVNGTALCVQSYTQPGDAVVLIEHHTGAVTMIKELLASPPQDETAFRLAADISADQTTEIARMERMLAAMKP